MMVGDGYRGEVDQSEIRQENDKWQGWVRRRLDGPWRPWLWPWSDPKMMRFPEISSNVPPRSLLLYTTIHWIEPSKTHPFYPTMPQIHLIITYRKDLFSIRWRTPEKRTWPIWTVYPATSSFFSKLLWVACHHNRISMVRSRREFCFGKVLVGTPRKTASTYEVLFFFEFRLNLCVFASPWAWGEHTLGLCFDAPALCVHSCNSPERQAGSSGSERKFSNVESEIVFEHNTFIFQRICGKFVWVKTQWD